MNLKLFCSNLDVGNLKTIEPFSDNNYTYATNGHILVRIPRIVEITAPIPVKPELIRNIMGDIADDVEWESMPTEKITFVTCPDCKGSGKISKCPECEGSGEVEVSNGYNDYHADCKTCDGKGHTKGDGKTCYNCEGKGRIINNNERIKWFNRLIAPKYYHLLQEELEGVQFAKLGEPLDPIRFRFNGGDGALMPMRY